MQVASSAPATGKQHALKFTPIYFRVNFKGCVRMLSHILLPRPNRLDEGLQKGGIACDPFTVKSQAAGVWRAVRETAGQ